jgi:hypothetical protein
MKTGFYICRDGLGDKGYSLWTVEPTFYDGEWVPDSPTRGRSIYAAIAESFAVALLGHKLQPAGIEFVPTSPKRRRTAA